MLNKRHVEGETCINASFPDSVVGIKFQITSRNFILTNVSISIDVDSSVIINLYIALIHSGCKLDSVGGCFEKLCCRETNVAWRLLSNWCEVGSIPDVLNFVDICFSINKSILADIRGFEGAAVESILWSWHNSHLIVQNWGHNRFNAEISSLPEITAICFSCNLWSPSEK